MNLNSLTKEVVNDLRNITRYCKEKVVNFHSRCLFYDFINALKLPQLPLPIILYLLWLGRQFSRVEGGY